MINSETITKEMCNITNGGAISLLERCKEFKYANKIIIPEKINDKKIYIIDSNGFSHCKGINLIELPQNLTSIGECAFKNCIDLVSIDIPDTVLFVNSEAFANCSSLVSVTIPQSVFSLKPGTFKNCANLQTINLLNEPQTIPAYFSYNCPSLKNIILPKTVFSIDATAFDKCKNLEIAYRGTQIQLDRILTNRLKNVFSNNNITIFSSYIIDEYITALLSNDKNIIKPDIISKPQKDYFKKELLYHIYITTDLPLKLKLLEIYDNIFVIENCKKIDMTER